MTAYHVTQQHQAVVVSPDGKVKPVKNLGWLRSNWASVERFEIRESPLGKFPHWDALMIAHLRNGGRYEALWASREVMLNWIHRPIFRGLPVTWFGENRKASPRRSSRHSTSPDAIGRLAHRTVTKIARAVRRVIG